MIVLKMKRLLPYICLLLLPLAAYGQKDTLLTVENVWTDEFLDTVQVAKATNINDYSMIGFQYGVTMSQVMFNPTKKQERLFTPGNIGIMFTHYEKMFGLMPYFGYQIGFFYGQNGYFFKPDKDDGQYHYWVDGAAKGTYSFIEMPVLSHFHIDVWKMKLLLEAGMYVGYRFKVEREGPNLDEQYTKDFYDYDRKFDYGAKFGAGLGIMLDPIEIHFKAQYKWSMSSLYEPDYRSEYYYRFAYPMDFIFSAGVHFQLTKRTGKTKSQLKRDARDTVYNTGSINQ